MNSNELKDLQDKYNQVRMFNASMEAKGAISMEASVMDYLRGFASTAGNFIGSITKKIKGALGYDKPVEIKNALIVANSHTYDECAKIPLFTVAGLNVPLVTYAGKLKESFAKMEEFDIQFIIPLTKYLLEVVNNPNLLMSQTHKFSLKLDVQDAKKELKAMLSGNNSDKGTWGSLFASNNDVVVLSEMLPELYEMVNKRKIESTNSSIENLRAVVDELIAIIREKTELTAGVNMRHANEISDSIMNAATYLEFYSLLLIQIRAVFGVLEANETELHKFLKKK